MKLRTEIGNWSDGSINPVRKKSYSQEQLFSCLEHDVKWLHAIVKAMDEWGEKKYGDAVDKLCVRWIRLRADELMLEWGFES